MKNLSRIIIFCSIIVFVMIFSGCEKTPEIQSEKINIVTSVFPISEIAEKVGGKQVTVTNITPVGVEPHDYEPTPKEVILLNKADIVIINGAGMESWGENITENLKNKNIPVLILAEHVSSLIEHEHDEEHEDIDLMSQDNSHDHGKYDPHFLLDPVIYMEAIDNVKSALTEIDPENKDYYEDNSKNYREEILQLHQSFASVLSSCKKRIIVTNHEAFNYFAKRYGITLIAIAGLSPEVEPSAKKLTELIKLVKENNIEYIFTETLVSPKIAETLAAETGAKTLILNPMEGLTKNEIEEGKNYIIVSRENLANLKTALECEI